MSEYEMLDTKYPCFIKAKSSDIFSLGGIYNTWVDKASGEMRSTFGVNNERNERNTPESIKEVAYPELSEMTLF